VEKYRVTVTSIGPQVEELRSGNIVILFDEGAPPELAEISVLHTKGELLGQIKAGDILLFGDLEYHILEVGSKANENMALLGHCCLKFDKDLTLLHGDIRLDGTPPPLEVRQEIVIYKP